MRDAVATGVKVGIKLLLLIPTGPEGRAKSAFCPLRENRFDSSSVGRWRGAGW